MGYIAVIIAAYNAEAYIERCIRSVQNQTYGNWKVYVVDDGSTDNTLKILERIVRNEERVCAVHTENNGVFAARRTAIDLVENCEYLTFLDSDDFFC